jgi:hypothetical protein
LVALWLLAVMPGTRSFFGLSNYAADSTHAESDLGRSETRRRARISAPTIQTFCERLARAKTRDSVGGASGTVRDAILKELESQTPDRIMELLSEVHSTACEGEAASFLEITLVLALSRKNPALAADYVAGSYDTNPQLWGSFTEVVLFDEWAMKDLDGMGVWLRNHWEMFCSSGMFAASSSIQKATKGCERSSAITLSPPPSAKRSSFKRSR